MSKPTSIRIDNGSSWPLPEYGYDLIERIGGPISLDDHRTYTITRDELFTIRSIVGAYGHLAEHPAGTESAVKSLRSLRRGIAAYRAKETAEDV